MEMLMCVVNLPEDLYCVYYFPNVYRSISLSIGLVKNMLIKSQAETTMSSAACVELCLLKKEYAEDLVPSASECGLIWKQSL